MRMKVLEFKHIGPFDGCFHRWEYLAVDEEGIYPIIFTEGRLEPYQVVGLASGMELFAQGDSGWGLLAYSRLFKEFTWFEWEQELFDEISYGYMPAFWAFAEKMGLEFVWHCDECGEPQAEEPMYMAGWQGNGGIGIEVLGWLCEACASDQEDRNDYS